MPSFSARSKSRMVGLHPDLERVLNRAIKHYDFMVIEGVRSDEQCFINWGKGRTVEQCRRAGIPNPEKYAKPKAAKVTWLRNPLGSKHRKNSKTGFGHAVDIAPYPLDWNDIGRFRKMADAILSAAMIEEISLAWGGHWSKPDYPHFELL